MYKLCIYVPQSHVEEVKTAVFAAGAGRMGDYESCAWQTLGQGQFRPGSGADPFIGEAGELEKVMEYKVEMICSEDCIAAVIQALKEAHPYEEPAFDIIPMIDPANLV